MNNSDGHPVASVRDLSAEDIGRVGGGMKWDHNTVSKDVIDARGGSFTVLGVTVTFDVNGKVSSIG